MKSCDVWSAQATSWTCNVHNHKGKTALVINIASDLSPFSSQSKSDTEWKFGLAKLIRNTNRTSSAPAPLNLFTKLFIYIHAFIKFKGT